MVTSRCNLSRELMAEFMEHKKVCKELMEGISSDVWELSGWAGMKQPFHDRERGGSAEDEIRTWSFNRELIQVRIKDIFYIESYQRKAAVHTDADSQRIRSTLQEEEKMLESKGFIRIHHGYLVNSDKIKKAGTNHLILKNGVILPVSKRYRKSLYQFMGDTKKNSKK